MTMGWMGTMREVRHYLATVGADCNEKGEFLLVGPAGSEPVTFMGDTSPDAETVIPDEVCYLVGGKKAGLANGLGGTSYGLRVHVI
jgi:hypothetical protein